MTRQNAKWPVVLLMLGVMGMYLHAHPLHVKPTTVTMEPGTAIELRLDHTVSSKTSTSGQPFSGKLAKPIVLDGKVVVPDGTEFSGKVMEAVPAGHLAGGATLKVALTTFSLDGTDYTVQTAPIVRVTQGQGKRTAKLTGGGAVLGAAIGALAHGKKGALIGAAAGAGVGAAGSAATNPAHDIVMPSESVLTFKLTQPVVVTPKSSSQTPHDLLATVRGLFS